MEVGAELDASCGRCGTSPHVVIALVGGQVAQVECRRCNARHRLRSQARAAAPRRTPSAPKKRVSVARPLVAPDLLRPPSPYHPGDRYAPSDRIAHPRFGVGVVELVLGPGKVQVWFDDGERVLVHGREI